MKCQSCASQMQWSSLDRGIATMLFSVGGRDEAVSFPVTGCDGYMCPQCGHVTVEFSAEPGVIHSTGRMIGTAAVASPGDEGGLSWSEEQDCYVLPVSAGRSDSVWIEVGGLHLRLQVVGGSLITESYGSRQDGTCDTHLECRARQPLPQKGDSVAYLDEVIAHGETATAKAAKDAATEIVSDFERRFL